MSQPEKAEKSPNAGIGITSSGIQRSTSRAEVTAEVPEEVLNNYLEEYSKLGFALGPAITIDPKRGECNDALIDLIEHHRYAGTPAIVVAQNLIKDGATEKVLKGAVRFLAENFDNNTVIISKAVQEKISAVLQAKLEKVASSSPHNPPPSRSRP